MLSMLSAERRNNNLTKAANAPRRPVVQLIEIISVFSMTFHYP